MKTLPVQCGIFANDHSIRYGATFIKDRPTDAATAANLYMRQYDRPENLTALVDLDI